MFPAQQAQQSLPTRRSLIDPSVKIDATRALVALVGPPKGPLSLYLESYILAHQRKRAYLFAPERKYRLLKLSCVIKKDKTYLTVWESVKNVPIHSAGCWTFKVVISARLAQALYQYNLSSLSGFANFTPLEFYKKLLSLNNITLPLRAELSYNRKAPYPITDRAYVSYIKHFGIWYDSIIDPEKERRLTSDLLGTDEKLSPSAQLKSLYQKRSDIDITPELFNHIQFVQDRFNINIFTYKSYLEDIVLKTIKKLPYPLLQLIVEYVEAVADLISNYNVPLQIEEEEKRFNLNKKSK